MLKTIETNKNLNVWNTTHLDKMNTPVLKKHWSLSPTAFARLLKWIDGASDSGGEKYLELRTRLEDYFRRKNCLKPDELADETLNRVARRIEESGAIEGETPAKFCYATARFVFLESLRDKSNFHICLDDAPSDRFAVQTEQTEYELKEEERRYLQYLSECLKDWSPENTEIILNYYAEDTNNIMETRRLLAEKLKITPNALRIRACRLRESLEKSFKKRFD